MTSYAATAMTPKSEDERDRPAGAGAALERQNGQPRALSRRGGRGSRSAKFYAPLSQMPPISQRRSSGESARGAAAARITALGEFSGSARSITTPSSDSTHGRDFEAERLLPANSGSSAEAHEAAGEEAPDSDSELGAILGAIDDEVEGIAAAARTGIMAEFAGRIASARKHLPRSQIAAAVAALKAARKAALALVKRHAAQERAGRKKAATAGRGRRPRAAGARRTRNYRTGLN